MNCFLYIICYIILIGTINTHGETSVSPENFEEFTKCNFTTPASSINATINTTDISYIAQCPTNADCNTLGGNCIDCDFNSSCVYGQETTTICCAKPEIVCLGERNFQQNHACKYCYQLSSQEYSCTSTQQCSSYSSPPQMIVVTCTVNDDIICLGKRTFFKNAPCNWTSGYKWSTALALSVTLGGFGVDRFYLGHWKEGIGKLFSFGGLGVWTLVDVILVGIGYITPADGSLYVV